MRWVKLTLAPVVRASWLLRIWRLTSSSLAGTVRTLVAVGTARLASMLATMRAAAPRSATASMGAAPLAGGAAAAGAVAAGAGCATAGAGAAARPTRRERRRPASAGGVAGGDHVVTAAGTGAGR